MGSGPTSQYKHSTIFTGDSIIRDDPGHRRGRTQYNVSVDGEVDTSWGEIPSIKKSGRSRLLASRPRMLSRGHAPIVMLFILFFFFLKIPNFFLDRAFGFSIHREYILVCP